MQVRVLPGAPTYFMFWANFLHFYQPPTQKKYWVDRVTDESYRRLIDGWLKNPNIRLTLNVNACLYELWEKYGHNDVIDGLKNLLDRGQLEFTGSAKYHPLLPKLPNQEIVRQIELNNQTCQHYLGDSYQPKGFFPPEMAYEKRIAQIAADMGFEWIIGEELSYRYEPGAVKYDRLYSVKDVSRNGQPLLMFFRERNFSFKILSGQLGTANLFANELGNRLMDGSYLLTAMDGETFGHHRPGMEKQLVELYQTSGVQAVTISQLAQHVTNIEETDTLPATWALMEKDLTKNIPFARWEDPDNVIHRYQWELTDLAVKTVQNSKFKIQNEKTLNFTLSTLNSDRGEENLTKEQSQWLEARRLLDRALHSDQYWWASARPWWSLEMVERGARELTGAVDMVPDVSEAIKKKAQELYFQIITTGFDWQRTGKVDELCQKEDEEVRMRTDAGLPKLPAEELEKMIAHLRQEMLAVAGAQEYERAGQLRDRIKELESYKK